MHRVSIRSHAKTEMLDITEKVKRMVQEANVQSGMCVVYVPHTTAGITINENADPDVVSDMLNQLNRMVPFENGYRHLEGNSAAHIKASMFGFSVTVIIEDYQLQLGTWQGIYLCEFDGPRNRELYVKILQD